MRLDTRVESTRGQTDSKIEQAVGSVIVCFHVPRDAAMTALVTIKKRIHPWDRQRECVLCFCVLIHIPNAASSLSFIVMRASGRRGSYLVGTSDRGKERLVHHSSSLYRYKDKAIKRSAPWRPAQLGLSGWRR